MYDVLLNMKIKVPRQQYGIKNENVQKWNTVGWNAGDNDNGFRMAQTYDIWDHSPHHPWSDICVKYYEWCSFAFSLMFYMFLFHWLLMFCLHNLLGYVVAFFICLSQLSDKVET